MKIKNHFKIFLFVICPIFSFVSNAQEKSQSSAQELADKLSNPVSNLISVPFQNNVDYGIGNFNGSKYTLNFQPVIPIPLSPKINLITRYIIPIVDQRDITGEGTSQFGLSDATVSAFFAPADMKNGLIWGVGPEFLVPIGTNDFLSTRKWGIGPSVLLAKQKSGMTYGFLVNQIWSFAGDENRSDVNQMYFQPFFSKNFKSGAGLGLSSEMTFNWEGKTTSIFLIPQVTAVTKLGNQPISLSIAPKIPVTGPDETKPDFGIRASLTFVFTK
jgi:hypothetical protein